MRPAFEALFKLAELEIQRGPSEAERRSKMVHSPLSAILKSSENMKIFQNFGTNLFGGGT